MRSFEERFAAVGRAMDRTIEAVRERRPARFSRRSGPTLRERIGERARRAREFVAEGHWRNWADLDEHSRKRLGVLAVLLGLALLMAVPWWFVRGVGSRAGFDEIIAQERMRIRLEMAAGSGTSEGGTLGSWGGSPGAGAKIQSERRWGPE